MYWLQDWAVLEIDARLLLLKEVVWTQVWRKTIQTGGKESNAEVGFTAALWNAGIVNEIMLSFCSFINYPILSAIREQALTAALGPKWLLLCALEEIGALWEIQSTTSDP